MLHNYGEHDRMNRVVYISLANGSCMLYFANIYSNMKYMTSYERALLVSLIERRKRCNKSILNVAEYGHIYMDIKIQYVKAAPWDDINSRV